MKKRLYILNHNLLIMLIGMLFSLHSQAYSQVLQEDIWQTNGTVSTLIQDGSTLYLGGSFNMIGPSAPNFTGLDLSAQPDLGLPPVQGGEVNAIASDGAGGWYIGGKFTQVGDSSRNKLAHILADKTVGAWNPGANWDWSSFVNAIAYSNGVVYFGGAFSITIGGQTRFLVAATDVNGNIIANWDAQLEEFWVVNTIAISDTVIYIGGTFQNSGTTPRSRLAAVGVSGALLPWNPGADSDVNSIAINDTVVYVGGKFSTIGGLARDKAAAIGFSGAVLDWVANAGGSSVRRVYSISVYDTSIYLGGNFTTINGVGRTGIAEIGISGVLTDWAPTLSSSSGVSVFAIQRSGSYVFAGGNFTDVNGFYEPEAEGLTALDASTGATVSWKPGLSNTPTTPLVTVKALLIDGTTLYTGGSFNIAGGKSRKRLAAFDLTTNTLLPFYVDVATGSVNKMVLNNGNLYFGGSFTTVNGSARSRLAAVDVATANLLSWDPNAGNIVTALTIADTIIYVGGNFTTMSGQTRTRLAAIGVSGALLDWAPTASSNVGAIEVKDTVIYVGGGFTNISGTTRNRLAAIGVSGALLGWDPNASSTVNSIVINDTTIYVGGNFTTISGETRNRLAAIGTSGTLLPWNIGASSSVNGLFIASNNLYIGGNFTTLGDSSRTRLGSIDLTTGDVTAWNPTASSYVGAFATFDELVYIGGNFTNINDKIKNYFAAITDPSLAGAPTTFQLSVDIENNWNMVSIPGLHPVDQNVNTWWPGMVSGSSVYEFVPGTGYNPVTVATPTEGYWMKNNGTQTYNTGDEWPASGILFVPYDPITVEAGWNLLGGYDYNAAVAGISPAPVGSVYGFSNTTGYTAVTELVAGYGYWAKFASAGQVTLPPPTFKSITKTTVIDDSWGRIIITDNAGKSYTLYGVNGNVELNNYELPPLPPSGLFDVRYGSGRFVEDISSGQTIDMQGVEYPVSVRVEGITIQLQDASGEIVNANLTSGEELTINNSSVNKLVILFGEVTAPVEYALEQNYPNPFNPSTTIRFSIPEAANVTLSIYNVLGEKVAQLVNEKLEAGKYSYQWDASKVATGLYIYEMRTSNFVSTKKMLLLK